MYRITAIVGTRVQNSGNFAHCNGAELESETTALASRLEGYVGPFY